MQNGGGHAGSKRLQFQRLWQQFVLGIVVARSTRLLRVAHALFSILLNQSKLQVDKLPGWPNSAVSSLKLPPETSVLKLNVGAAVHLTETDFVRLSQAFFEEIEQKYA